MNIQQKINLEGKNISVHDFLDNQRLFIMDASIICGGFHNIMNHENTCSDKFLGRLEILYNKIYERYTITLGLSDKLAGKQEIYLGMGKLLIDIETMKEHCFKERA